MLYFKEQTNDQIINHLTKIYPDHIFTGLNQTINIDDIVFYYIHEYAQIIHAMQQLFQQSNLVNNSITRIKLFRVLLVFLHLIDKK